jgi:hypothetical protein
MDSALRHAPQELGQPPDQPLEWTEQEGVALAAACAAADRCEVLGKDFAAEERAKQPSSALLVKLSAEMRALDRQVVDLLGKINPGLGQAVSERHQKALRRDLKRRDHGGSPADGEDRGRQGRPDGRAAPGDR